MYNYLRKNGYRKIVDRHKGNTKLLQKYRHYVANFLESTRIYTTLELGKDKAKSDDFFAIADDFLTVLLKQAVKNLKKELSFGL